MTPSEMGHKLIDALEGALRTIPKYRFLCKDYVEYYWKGLLLVDQPPKAIFVLKSKLDLSVNESIEQLMEALHIYYTHQPYKEAVARRNAAASRATPPPKTT